MKTTTKLLLAAAVAGAITARPVIAASGSSDGSTKAPSIAEKSSCKSKDGCKSKDSTNAPGDKASCKSKEGCKAKDSCKSKDGTGK